MDQEFLDKVNHDFSTVVVSQECKLVSQYIFHSQYRLLFVVILNTLTTGHSAIFFLLHINTCRGLPLSNLSKLHKVITDLTVWSDWEQSIKSILPVLESHSISARICESFRVFLSVRTLTAHLVLIKCFVVLVRRFKNKQV